MKYLWKILCFIGFHYVPIEPERRPEDGYLKLHYCKYCGKGFET